MNFIEESDRYIIRGLTYLILWFLFAPIVFIVIGAGLLGVPGMVIGVAAAIALGIWGYSAYLDWRYRKMMRAHRDSIA